MIVTGAFLAEAASVEGGKLFVLGGVITQFHRGADQGVGIVIVVLTQSDEDRADYLPGSVHAPDGAEVPIEIPIPEITQTGRDAGFLIGQIGLPPEAPDGRYVLVVGGVSLPFYLQTATPSD